MNRTTSGYFKEFHSYPFGLIMSGISSKALNNAPVNRKKFNGIEHTTEFDLNTYDAFYRNADPQIGRWWQIDPKPNMAESPYSMMGNNPILNADPLGDTLRVSFRGGFLGLGKKREVTYNNGTLTNKDGSAYTGKVKGFLGKAVNALNTINGTTDGGKVVSSLQSSTNTFTVKNANLNPNKPGSSEFIETGKDINKSYAVAMTAAGQGKPVLGGVGGDIYWNPSGTSLPVVGGTGVSPIADLAHEMFHAYEANVGMLNNDDPQGTGLSRMEYRASYFENQIRNAIGQPYRREYWFRDASGNQGIAPLLDASGKPIYVPPTPIPPSLLPLGINLIY